MIKKLCRLIFKMRGWKMNMPVPDGSNHCVMIAAPHTSNWDAIYLVAAFDLMKIPMRFTVKNDWLKFPFKSLFLSVGAIGIDRSPKVAGQERLSMVEVMTDLIKTNDRIALVVTPEGTRGLRTTWKTGFYYVAVNANVPIALGYMDYGKKECGVGKLIYPSGDMKKDLKEIMDFYHGMTAKFPEKFSVDLEYLGK